jgi:tetratricopeptide (TPR) repeat protein
VITNNAHTKSHNSRLAEKVSDVASASAPDSIGLTPEQKENKICSLAGEGKLEEALNECNEAIAISKLNMRLYYLKASVLQEMNKNAEALSSLRQALYIKPDHAIGHFSIGSIFMKNGEYTKATRHFRNVLELTKDLLDDIILPDSEGMSLGLIRETINSTLKI